MTMRAETTRRAFLVATCVAASGCAGGDGNEDTGTFSSPRPRSKTAKRYRRSTRVTARETRRLCVSITCPKGRRRSRSSSTTPTHPVGRTYTGSSGTCQPTQRRYYQGILMGPAVGELGGAEQGTSGRRCRVLRTLLARGRWSAHVQVHGVRRRYGTRCRGGRGTRRTRCRARRRDGRNCASQRDVRKVTSLNDTCGQT